MGYSTDDAQAVARHGLEESDLSQETAAILTRLPALRASAQSATRQAKSDSVAYDAGLDQADSQDALRAEQEQARLRKNLEADKERDLWKYRLDYRELRNRVLERAQSLGHLTSPPFETVVFPDGLCEQGSRRPLLPLGCLYDPNVNPNDGEALAVSGEGVWDVPAVAPFIDSGNLLIEAPGMHVELQPLMAHVLGQILLSAPPGQVHVSVYDPNLSQLVDTFFASGGRDAGVMSVIGQRGLQQALSELVDHVQQVSQTLGGRHSSMGSLIDASGGQQQHAYRVLILLGFPAVVDQDSARLLSTLLSHGGRLGLSILIHRDRAVEAPRGVDLDFLDTIPALRPAPSEQPEAGYCWEWLPFGIGGKSFQVSPFFGGHDDVERLMKHVRDAAAKAQLPEIPFADLLAELAADPTHVSSSGIRMNLGRQGRQTVELVLGNSRSNIHNVLVGGAVGTGKTNLLKIMIYSLAAHYPPAELELFLLDFKQGVEFREFAPRSGPALPHARVVSVESDVAFGLATLRYFRDELDRRRRIFPEGVSDFESYRNSGGQLARWVLVVDEFQRLFEGDSYGEATDLLEAVVRQGRSYGLHVVLASQSLSGIRFSGGKEDAIFGQFAGRIVLQMSARESRIFLGPNNEGAATLKYRGQAILNTQAGDPSENRSFNVAFAEPEMLKELQSRLAREFPSVAARIYEGRKPVTVSEVVRAQQAPPVEQCGRLPVWLAQQPTIEAEVAGVAWESTTGSNLLVLGPARRTALATVQLAALSYVTAARQMRVMVLDALPEHAREEALVREWLQALRACGGSTEVYEAVQATELVSRLCEHEESSGATLVVVLGSERTDFNRAWSDMDCDRRVAAWNRNGLHIIGHWNDVRELPYRHPSDVQQDFHTMVFTEAPATTISEIVRISPQGIAPSEPGRVLVYSAARHDLGLQSAVALAPWSMEDFAGWMRLASDSQGSNR